MEKYNLLGDILKRDKLLGKKAEDLESQSESLGLTEQDSDLLRELAVGYRSLQSGLELF